MGNILAEFEEHLKGMMPEDNATENSGGGLLGSITERFSGMGNMLEQFKSGATDKINDLVANSDHPDKDQLKNELMSKFEEYKDKFMGGSGSDEEKA